MFVGSKRKSKGLATEHDVHEAGGQKCVEQNLNIAFVFWILSKNSATNHTTVKQIIEFIKGNKTKYLIKFGAELIFISVHLFSGILGSLNSLTPDTLQIVVKVLRTILVENASDWLNIVPTIKELLVTVLATYQRGSFPKEMRTRIMIMLCDIVLDHKLYAAYGEDVFSSWLPTLPNLLCQPHISSHILKTFSHLGRQKNAHFMKHLELNQAAILGKSVAFDFFSSHVESLNTKNLYGLLHIQKIYHKFKSLD